MPLAVLVIVTGAAGFAVAQIARRMPAIEATPAPAAGTRAHLGPEAVRGLALSIALGVLAVGGLVLGTLAYLVRSDEDGIGWDAAAANWGDRHASDASTAVLEAISFFGRPTTIVVMAILLAAEEFARTRSRWVVPFLVVVVAGNGVLTTTIKALADRVRPELNPIAETLGPSFPSGHSSWSAAFFAAAALLLGRGRTPRTRSVLAGVGAGCAVAIATTRVLLDVHWLTDVIAGLALGWAWFAACAIAFGRRGGARD